MTKGSQIFTGIDLGTTKTTACAGSYDDSGMIRIHESAMVRSRGIERGVVTNFGEAAGCIEEVIKKIEKKIDNSEQLRSLFGRKNLRIDSVFATLSGDHILGNSSRGMLNLSSHPVEIDRKIMQRSVDSTKYLAVSIDREILHSLPQDFIIDGSKRVKDPVGIFGTRLGVNLYVVTAEVSFTTNVVKAINRAGYDVEGMAYSGVATAASLLTEQDKQLGVVLLELGGGSINILFFSEGSLQYLNVIPQGGYDVTMEISRRLGVDFMQAEELKMQYKSLASGYSSSEDAAEDRIIIRKDSANYESISRIELIKIIDEKVMDLLSLVKKDLDLSGVIPRAHAGIVVCGGMAFLDGIIEKVEEFIKLPVNLGIMRGFVSAVPGLSNLFYATSIGLVIHSLKERSQLRPDKYVPAGIMGKITSKFKAVYEEYF